MAKQNALNRVGQGRKPLTKEQAQAFVEKRAALRSKHGMGSDAREAILGEFQLTEEEQVALLDYVLWDLFHTGLTGNDIVTLLSGEE